MSYTSTSAQAALGDFPGWTIGFPLWSSSKYKFYVHYWCSKVLMELFMESIGRRDRINIYWIRVPVKNLDQLQ